MIKPSGAPVALPDFLAHKIHAPAYIIEPYIPAGGIVFLYGKSSIGKSPLTWEMARCVALGIPWLGHRTTKQAVLYLDVDGTPPAELQKRLALLPKPPPDNFYLSLRSPFNILERGPQGELTRGALHKMADEIRPGLVIINTLRKVHWGDDKESDVPSRVYHEFHTCFPGATVVFVHHDKKTNNVPGVVQDQDETFSGSQAWLNDATVALHLRRSGPETGHLRLDHTKSQVSEKRPPLMLVLEEDGTTLKLLRETHTEKLAEVWAGLDQSKTKRELVAEASVILGCSPRTVWRWLEGADRGAADIEP